MINNKPAELFLDSCTY